MLYEIFQVNGIKVVQHIQELTKLISGVSNKDPKQIRKALEETIIELSKEE